MASGLRWSVPALSISGSMQRSTGWGFDVEILYLARRRGYRVQQLAIDWYYDADSRVRGLSDSLSMLGEIL